MSDHDAGWLADVAAADGVSVPEAAGYFVEAGVPPEDWRALGTAERAALVAARRLVAMSTRIQSLDDAGQDLSAAALRAQFDGGSSAARLMAQAAGQAVANARQQQREAGSGLVR